MQATSTGTVAGSTGEAPDSGGTSSTPIGSESSGGSCLPPPPGEFNLQIELSPLIPDTVEGIIEGPCTVTSQSSDRLRLVCPDGASLSIRQIHGIPIAFDTFPTELSVRSYHQTAGFGNPSDELVVRTVDGDLLLGYLFSNGYGGVLDASWGDSLGDLDAELSDGDCIEEIEVPCAICQSRGLEVAGDGLEGTLVHGDRFDAGPWTFEVARLLSCEATCSPGIHPLYILATINESVLQ